MKKPLFRVGETVVDPQLGICDVSGLNFLHLDGKEELYYVLHSSNTKIMVPESQVINRGLRKPVSKKEALGILDSLSRPVECRKTFVREQYPRDYAILKIKDLHGISKLLRELVILEKRSILTKRYKAISYECRNILNKELAYSLNCSKEVVHNKIKRNLSKLVKFTTKTKQGLN